MGSRWVAESVHGGGTSAPLPQGRAGAGKEDPTRACGVGVDRASRTEEGKSHPQERGQELSRQVRRWGWARAPPSPVPPSVLLQVPLALCDEERQQGQQQKWRQESSVFRRRDPLGESPKESPRCSRD